MIVSIFTRVFGGGEYSSAIPTPPPLIERTHIFIMTHEPWIFAEHHPPTDPLGAFFWSFALASLFITTMVVFTIMRRIGLEHLLVAKSGPIGVGVGYTILASIVSIAFRKHGYMAPSLVRHKFFVMPLQCFLWTASLPMMGVGKPKDAKNIYVPFAVATFFMYLQRVVLPPHYESRRSRDADGNFHLHLPDDKTVLALFIICAEIIIVVSGCGYAVSAKSARPAIIAFAYAVALHFSAFEPNWHETEHMSAAISIACQFVALLAVKTNPHLLIPKSKKY